jgi:hypothetical protein
MKTLHSLVLGASLIVALAGGSSAPTGAGAVDAWNEPSGVQEVGTPVSVHPRISCLDGTPLERVLTLTAMPRPNAPKTKCTCGTTCPFTYPPADCGEGFKRCKKTAPCNFNLICDAVFVECSLKTKVETCVPKGQPCS